MRQSGLVCIVHTKKAPVLAASQGNGSRQCQCQQGLVRIVSAVQALGEADEAEHNLRRAHGVCCEVQALESSAALPPQVARKLQLLLGVLQAQRQQHPAMPCSPVGATAAAAAADS